MGMDIDTKLDLFTKIIICFYDHAPKILVDRDMRVGAGKLFG
jgi:hypothetical protein